ncbi:MBL fold metallo-hydrolase [Limisalsivibrio acetivorans]|uniref:MBL fold metallo-hydrolase n=1 Tax=Limisalsivibrio acetivorans TaxID=1304888 RepID=UPI0003B334C2|nr:MBL fold metallo-hydrolase [Limisalsivibrio acetivorans]
MRIETVILQPLSVNCYLIVSDDKEALIVDPGGEPERVAAKIEELGVKPVGIINTHGHFDHIGGVTELKNRYGIPFSIHKDDDFLLTQSVDHAAKFGFPRIDPPKAERLLSDGDKIEFGGEEIEVIHTPGHTPGGVSLYIPAIKTAITGDTLFREAVGRSDFPYAEHETLIKSVKERLLVLPDETKVLPGHDIPSTIGHEKKWNPFT